MAVFRAETEEFRRNVIWKGAETEQSVQRLGRGLGGPDYHFLPQ
jgi:hypothetical protein